MCDQSAMHVTSLPMAPSALNRSPALEDPQAKMARTLLSKGAKENT
jgi:hypothetical protein